MKTMVLYASKYGFTREIVTELVSQLKGDMHAFDVTKNSVPHLGDMDGIILGSSIYVGQINKKLRQWIENNQSLLLS